MKIDQDNLRTGIAIGCHASRELCPNCLLLGVTCFWIWACFFSLFWKHITADK